ncbi:MAG TPA: transglutaminase family protein [Caulobacteraceae bacterium]|nr:transglutaminase family protein [Caulobacteraceae bacterium]
MRIRAGFTIAFECPGPAPMLLMLSVHPSRRSDLEVADDLRSDPALPMTRYRDGFGNICHRLLAPAGPLTLASDFVIRDTGLPDRRAPGAAQTPVEELPDGAVVFLLGSRYCETELLSDAAWSLFERFEPGWPRAQAIVDWVHDNITFGYPHARKTRTAFETFQEKVGVCRDFAHLAVAFCRCMNIPARYCSGYLGDIGVPPVGPMDFSAWFEAWLDGSWYAFDPRNHQPRIGRILMARGRDATDTAIATTFGPADLVRFEVVTDELSETSSGA